MCCFHILQFISFSGVLDPDNKVDLMVLHCLYLPHINHSLEEFTKAWNKNPIRTVSNWSPYKIWINVTISMNDEDDTNISEMEQFGVDEEGP